MVVVVITVWRCRLIVVFTLMVLIIDYWDIGCSMRSSLGWIAWLALMVLIIDGVFPYGYSGVGCCVYTDYGAFYGGYGCFVGLWLR